MSDEPRINALELVKSYGENAYLIAPATDRFSVSTDLMVPYPTQVIINPNPQAGDVHSIDGRLALSATALGRLSTAAGIVWSERQTRPITVTKDYICYRAVGYLRLPDGSTIPLIGTKEIDLDTITAESQLNKCKKMYGGRAYDSLTEDERRAVDHAVHIEMTTFRKHRMGRAETGAKTRAIRSLGIRSSYTAAELTKPFVVVRWGINPNHEYAQAERQALWGELTGRMPANPLPAHEDPYEDLGEIEGVEGVDDVDFEVGEALEAPQNAPPPSGTVVDTTAGEIIQPEPAQSATDEVGATFAQVAEDAEEEERAEQLQAAALKLAADFPNYPEAIPTTLAGIRAAYRDQYRALVKQVEEAEPEAYEYSPAIVSARKKYLGEAFTISTLWVPAKVPVERLRAYYQHISAKIDSLNSGETASKEA